MRWQEFKELCDNLDFPEHVALNMYAEMPANVTDEAVTMALMIVYLARLNGEVDQLRRDTHTLMVQYKALNN